LEDLTGDLQLASGLFCGALQSVCQKRWLGLENRNVGIVSSRGFVYGYPGSHANNDAQPDSLVVQISHTDSHDHKYTHVYLYVYTDEDKHTHEDGNNYKNSDTN
jgi:hypothetical protein